MAKGDGFGGFVVGQGKIRVNFDDRRLPIQRAFVHQRRHQQRSHRFVGGADVKEGIPIHRQILLHIPQPVARHQHWAVPVDNGQREAGDAAFCLRGLNVGGEIRHPFFRNPGRGHGHRDRTGGLLHRRWPGLGRLRRRRAVTPPQQQDKPKYHRQESKADRRATLHCQQNGHRV